MCFQLFCISPGLNSLWLWNQDPEINVYFLPLTVYVTLTKTFTVSWLSSSICKTRTKILTLLIRLWYRLVILALQNCLQKKSSGCKNHSKQRIYLFCTSLHILPFPVQIIHSFLPHFRASQVRNELMVDITRHSSWNKLMKCEAMHNLVPSATEYTCTLSHVWLWDPMDCSLPGSSIHGISLARH